MADLFAQARFFQRAAPPPCPTHLPWEFYQGERAYQFLLEIICGLHSPLLGETEVLGQFRAFCAAARFPANHWGQFLRQLTGELMRDAKRIRHQHLQQLGLRSYGSLASRMLSDVESIAVLGAGQLAQEMLPALTERADLSLYARHPRRVALSSAPPLTLRQWPTEVAEWAAVKTGLVIAAPLTASEIENWAAQQKVEFTRVLDLRGESANDPLSLPSKIIDLTAFFASLQTEQKKAEQRATVAARRLPNASDNKRAKSFAVRMVGRICTPESCSPVRLAHCCPAQRLGAPAS